MQFILSMLMRIEWDGVIVVSVRLLCSALCGGLIGLERGRHGRAAGLRTHILLCIGASLVSLTGIFVVEKYGYGTDITRLAAQVISGIGFLGAGTILVRNNSVITGLTTAAGMWTTAAIGIAVGFGFHLGALAATIICIFSVTTLSHLESRSRRELFAYIELTDIQKTGTVVNALLELHDSLLQYEIIHPKSGHSNNVGINCRLSGEKEFLKLKEILAFPEIVIIIQTDAR